MNTQEFAAALAQAEAKEQKAIRTQKLLDQRMEDLDAREKKLEFREQNIEMRELAVTKREQLLQES